MRGSSASTSTAPPYLPRIVPQGDPPGLRRVGHRQRRPRPSPLHTEYRDRSKALGPPEIVFLPPLRCGKELPARRHSRHSSPPSPSLPPARPRQMRGEKTPEQFEDDQSKLRCPPRSTAANLPDQVHSQIRLLVAASQPRRLSRRRPRRDTGAGLGSRGSLTAPLAPWRGLGPGDSGIYKR